MTNFLALIKTEWLLTKRNPTSFIFSLILPVFFFLFFSSGVGNSAAEQATLRDYLISMTAFASLGLTFYTLPFSLSEDRRNNRIRLLKHTPVPMATYYVAKLLRIIIFYALAIMLNFMVGHFIRHVEMSAQDWLMSGVLLLLGAMLFLPYGLLLSQIKSPESMSAVSNICYIGLAMLGGMWMPLETLPSWLQSIGKLTPTYHFQHMVTSYLENGKIISNSLICLCIYAIVALFVMKWLSNKKEFGDR